MGQQPSMVHKTRRIISMLSVVNGAAASTDNIVTQNLQSLTVCLQFAADSSFAVFADECCSPPLLGGLDWGPCLPGSSLIVTSCTLLFVVSLYFLEIRGKKILVVPPVKRSDGLVSLQALSVVLHF